MKPDEGALKRDYCAGVLSIQKVADRHGIAKSTLMDMAKKYGWMRQKNPSKKSVQNKNGRTDEKTVEREKSDAKKNSLAAGDDGDDSPDEASNFGLSPQQANFAHYVAEGKSRVDAYRLAGYKGEGEFAYQSASRLYRNVKVSRYVRHLRDKFEKRQAATIDDLIHQYTAIANADPNELAQHRRVNCRYCWGEHHLYQWRDIGEHDRAAAKAAKDGKQPPDYGGLGFVDTADPHPDCPKCNGEGVSEVFITDTRDLEGNARWLYAGVKETKFGIEIQTANQDAARRELARLLTAHLTAGGKPGERAAGGYTPDDYRNAQNWIDNEFGDLD